MDPLVSIICRTYNQQDYIGESIQSALEQTYPHFELIIIDDCSTDGTPDVINSFKDERIRYVRKEKNEGPLQGLNTGIAMSLGKYISILDGDDIYVPVKLEEQVRFLERNIDYAAVFSYIDVIDGNGNYSNAEMAHKIKKLINNPAGSRSEMLKKCFAIYNFLAFPTEMFRREYAIFFDAHLLACGDGFFHISTLLKSKIKVFEKPLTKYRILDENKNVSTWKTELSLQSEKYFILDKFLEIKEPVLFEEVFSEELEKAGYQGPIDPRIFPYLLSLIAMRHDDKKSWGNYNFHRFISDKENYSLLVNEYEMKYLEIIGLKRGEAIPDANEQENEIFVETTDEADHERTYWNERLLMKKRRRKRRKIVAIAIILLILVFLYCI